MTNTPVCSIIVPLYNARAYIARTLSSVRYQTLSDWELIVVDDGSQDDGINIVRQIAEQDSRLRLIEQPNAGVANARNRGYAETDPGSPYLIFLDNDDTWEPEALTTMITALEADTSAGAAHVSTRYIDEADLPCTPEFIRQNHALLDDIVSSRRTVVTDRSSFRIEERPHDDRIGFATFAVSNCILSPGAVLLRREVVAALCTDAEKTPFDAAFAPCDDWHLWVRLTRRADMLALPQRLFNYRLHANNASRKQALMDVAWHRVVAEMLHSQDNDPLQRSIALAGMRFNRQRRISQRLAWAGETLRQGHLLDTARHLRQALRTYRWAYHQERNVSL